MTVEGASTRKPRRRADRETQAETSRVIAELLDLGDAPEDHDWRACSSCSAVMLLRWNRERRCPLTTGCKGKFARSWLT